MSLSSSIGQAMANAAHGAVLGNAIGELRQQVQTERAWRESAEAEVASMRNYVEALERYVKALKASASCGSRRR